MSGEEWVDLVDELDRVVGAATRREVRAGRLLHRGVAVLVRDGGGRVHVHRRTDRKDLFPGLYDLFAGGVVARGEGYAEAARRELAEELGLEGVEPRPLFRHLHLGSENRVWTAVYEAACDGPVRLQAEEISWGAFASEEEIEAMVERLGDRAFAADGLEIWRRWRRERGTRSGRG